MTSKRTRNGKGKGTQEGRQRRRQKDQVFGGPPVPGTGLSACWGFGGGGVEEGYDLRGSGGGSGGSGFCFQLGFAPYEVGEEKLRQARAMGGVVIVELGDRGQGAEGGVEDDFFDGLGGFGLDGCGASGGQVGGGDLEAVEEEPGAARVDLVGGDAAKDVGNSELETGAVVGVRQREVEGGPATAAGAVRIPDGLAGGVVVVAELFTPERGGAATPAIGVDVAALEALGRWVGGDGLGQGAHAWFLRPVVWVCLCH